MLAYPVAYWIAFYGGRRKSVFLFLLLLPFFVSFIIRTVQWQFLLADDGLILGPLKRIGLLPENYQVLGTATAVIAGITYNFLPFTALPLYVALERIDKRLVEAGKDLYATRFTTFRKVVWPLALPGVFAAFLLTFVPAVGDYVNAELLGGTEQPHDRQPHPVGVPDQPQLPAGGGDVVHPDGRAAHRGHDLRAGPRHRGRHVRGGVGMSMRPENPALISDSVGEPNVGDSPPPKTPSSKRWTRFILPTYTTLFILYLIIPIVVMIVFAFNTPAGRYNIKWEHASLDAWRNLFSFPDLSTSLKLSLEVAFLATIVATILGTFLGLALGRYRFRGAGAVNFVIFLAIASPEIVLGSSMLTMFVNARVPQGFVTILLAHIMFCISFVAITVRARVAGMDRSLEEAAGDLGADPKTTFFKVTLPIIMPGVIAGALLAFALSIDDFVITNFVAGSSSTFPLWVFGATRQGIPPQVNVMGTLLFTFGILIVVVQLLASRARARGDDKRLAQDKARLAAAQTS